MVDVGVIACGTEAHFGRGLHGSSANLVAEVATGWNESWLVERGTRPPFIAFPVQSKPGFGRMGDGGINSLLCL